MPLVANMAAGQPSQAGTAHANKPPETAQVTSGEDQLLACPATEPVALSEDNQCRIQNEEALDGSAVFVQESATRKERVQSYDPDLITVATLVDVVLSAVGVDRGAPGSVSLAMDLVHDVYSSALAVPAGRLASTPVAGVDAAGSLTALLRDAAGVSRIGPPTWDEASRLCDQIVHRTLSSLEMDRIALTWLLGTQPPDMGDETPDPEAGGAFQQAADEYWDENDDNAIDPATFEFEPDPPLTDPWVPDPTATPTAASISVFAVSATLFRVLLRPMGQLNYKRLLKFGLPQESRRKLHAWVRERERSGEIQPHTQKDGKNAERALLTLYLFDRHKHADDVLASTRVGGRTLKEVATAGSVWETVRTALTSFVRPPKALYPTVARPDILDPALREVYEIKPKARAVEAAEQLYGRFLLFLNAWESFSTVSGITARHAIVMAAQVLAKFTCYIGEPAPRNIDLSSIGALNFWTPGSWTPPRRILMWDMRLMDVEVPMPGLLCYQMHGHDPDEQSERKPVDIRAISLALLGLVLARALADAANQTDGAPGVEALARAAGDSTADGGDIVNWLLGVAAGTAAIAAATNLSDTLVKVAAWFGTFTAKAAEAVSGVLPPFFLPIDPKTGMPVGVQDRFGPPPT